MPSLRSLPLSAHGAGQCRTSHGVRAEPGRPFQELTDNRVDLPLCRVRPPAGSGASSEEVSR